MIRQIRERFPGIGCAWTDAAGKESAEYDGDAVRENHIAVVMTNRDPGVDQTESGMERLVDSKLNEKE